MGKYAGDTFSFDGCHICGVAKQAMTKDDGLSYDELVAAFDEQSKLTDKKNSLALQKSKSTPKTAPGSVRRSIGTPSFPETILDQKSSDQLRELFLPGA